MKKWAKRFSVFVAVVAVLAVAAVATWRHLLSRQPEWYRPHAGTPEQRAEAFDRANRKVAHTMTWAGTVRAVGAARAQGAEPTTHAADSYTLAFSEGELNALFEKWSTLYHWTDQYEGMLEDPTIVLRKDRFILAGRVVSLNTVASVHFEPKLDDNGRMHLDLVNVQGGRLPLPESTWTPERERVLGSLKSKLPYWQRTARFSADGSANQSAMAAGLSKLLFGMFNQDGGEPVVFLPSDKRTVPVKVTQLSVEDGSISLTVEPMTPPERAALLARIREPVPDAAAPKNRAEAHVNP